MKIGIVGLGLIGGSLGRAIKKKTEHEVFGLDINPKSIETAYMLSAIDEELSEDNLIEMDVVIIALYPRQIVEYMERFAPKMKAGAILMDAGGNKKMVCDKMRELAEKYPTVNYLGSHPMAGREFSGISHSSIVLFERASHILVPVSIELDKLAAMKKLSLDMGFLRVVITTEEEHDRMIAFTSQLAHIISNAYIQSECADKHVGFSAGSFRDMTRVAKLNSGMWAELMTENAEYLEANLTEFIENLTKIRDELKDRDEEGLRDLLEEGNQRKLYIDKL